MKTAMEFIREIYWNIGHGPGTLVPMHLFAALALVVLVFGFVRRLKIYQPLARWGEMMRTMLLQTKVLRVRGPELAHAMFFSGFFVLFLGTGLIVIQADFTDLSFDYVFLKGAVYEPFSMSLDLAGMFAIIMLLGLLVRRWAARPEGLETKVDDAIMHWLLLAILLTGFVVEGARMTVTELGTPLAQWSPVGLVIARGFSGTNPELLLALQRGLWWFRLALAMLFISLIPLSKFRHILTTSANYFFADRGPVGQLISLDLENEETERSGAAKKTDLSWKDLFDAGASTTCPHCFNTLSKDYRGLGLDCQVQSHPEFLAELITQGRLALGGQLFACTYHDSFYLGRHNGIYDPPRELIKAAGGKIVEMTRSRDQAFCCSAGGGRILAKEKPGTRINIKRVEMAVATGTNQLLSNCPFCLAMCAKTASRVRMSKRACGHVISPKCWRNDSIK